MKSWVSKAINIINADYQRSADTHLIKLEQIAFRDIDIYLKDESTHPTGSLKHRLARSLFLYALCNGKIVEGTTVVEASSGSTLLITSKLAGFLTSKVSPLAEFTHSPATYALSFNNDGSESIDDSFLFSIILSI